MSMDPLLPRQVITGRNGVRQVYRSSTGFPPIGTDPNDNIIVTGGLRPDGGENVLPMDDGGSPPGQAAFSQVMTLPGEPPAPHGDYIGLLRRDESHTIPLQRDIIVRARDPQLRTLAQQARHVANPTTWVSISDFDVNTVAIVATSQGHQKTVVYLVTTGGQVLKGQVDGSGRVPSWGTLAGLTQVTSLFVDPYDSRHVYVTDEGAGNIKSTPDGGLTWTVDTELTKIATNNGEFTFACKGQSFARLCPLQQMLFVHDGFVRGQPEILRVAILFPGGVAFSRDAGASWVRIDKLQGLDGLSVQKLADLIAFPYSGFYDADPVSGDSLYLALFGRGMVRIGIP
ncbi:MAG: hypothetical protein ACREL3_04680, partial [Gemmatimonadales bacterium]